MFTEQLLSDWMKQSETTMIIKTKLKKLFIDYTTQQRRKENQTFIETVFSDFQNYLLLSLCTVFYFCNFTFLIFLIFFFSESSYIIIKYEVQQTLPISNFHETGRFVRDRECSRYRKSYKMGSFQKINTILYFETPGKYLTDYILLNGIHYD